MPTKQDGGPSTGHELITQALGPDGLHINDGNRAIAEVLRSVTANRQLGQQVELQKEGDRLGVVISGTDGQPLFSLFQYDATDFEACFDVDGQPYALTYSDDSEEVHVVLTAFCAFASIAADDLNAHLVHGIIRVMALAANYNGNLPKEGWPEQFKYLLIDAE